MYQIQKNVVIYLRIVVYCSHSKRSSDQSLQFPNTTHHNFNFISDSGRLGRVFCLFFMARIESSPQTVRKVLARLKYSVPLYKARSGFSILTEEYLTFQTVSPSRDPQWLHASASSHHQRALCSILSALSCPIHSSQTSTCRDHKN